MDWQNILREDMNSKWQIETTIGWKKKTEAMQELQGEEL